jgi:hypothetical protein
MDVLHRTGPTGALAHQCDQWPREILAERVIKDADARPRRLDVGQELSLGEVQFLVTEFYAGGRQPSDEILIVLEDSDDQGLEGR